VTYGGLSDEDLLDRVAQSRDPAAFDTLYARYARAVYSLVRRTLTDHPSSEDVTQEAFASVWRAARGYRRERGAVAAWLFTIARNAATDAARARTPLTLADPPDQPDLGPSPSDQAIAEWEAFRLHSAVDSLQPREREVIELAYFSGLSQSEVAERLGLPLGTVKTRTRSALARLAGVLEEEVVPR
jgi:RNA polymerase sigma-70 factor (ECF subfamily)